jgi:AcrR family transcriptional regulator
MPKIVNKLHKRRKIALSVCELFIEQGFSDVSISQIAIQAGVGKGTIYEYFKNKEDIVLELMNSFQEKHILDFDEDYFKRLSTEEKILKLFEIFYNEADGLKIQRKIYKLFLAIHLNSKSNDVRDYYQNFKNKYLNNLILIIKNSIINKEIKQSSIKLVPSIFATVEGFFIEGESDKISDYISTIYMVLKENN